MTNYYEMLKLPTDSSAKDIEGAIDQLYNQWRRLVTHHDPNVVNRANQELQALTQIRETLTNPEKRSIYDAGIGLGGSVAGLADPSQILQSAASIGAVMSPASVQKPAAQPKPAESEDLWACYKCGSANPPLSMSCFKCGTQLMRECPECHEKRSLVKTGVCGNCGYKYEIAKQREDLRAQIARVQTEMEGVDQELNNARNVVVSGSGCATFFAWVFICGGLLGGLYGISASEGGAAIVSLLAIGLGIVIVISNRNSVKAQERRKNENIATIQEKHDHLEQTQTQLVTEMTRLVK